MTTTKQITKGQKFFIIMTIFVCGLLFSANAVAFNLISAPIFVNDIIAYAALTVAVTLTVLTLTIVIRDKRRSYFPKTQKSNIIDSSKESIETPSTILSPVDSQENIEKVDFNPAAVQTGNESDEAPVTPPAKSSRKRNLIAILMTIAAGLLLYVNVVAFNLIALPEYSMYVALAGAAVLTITTIATALIDKRRGESAKIQKPSIVSAEKESNESLETVPSSVDFQESTTTVETDKADVQTLNVSDDAQVSALPKAKSSKKRNLLIFIIAIVVGLLFFANCVVFGVISLPGYSAYAFVAGASALTIITVAIALIDKRKGVLPKAPIVEVVGAIKESNTVPETPDTVSSPTIAQTNADKVESDIAAIETIKVQDATRAPIAPPSKVFRKRNLFLIIVAFTVGLLVFANAGAFDLITLPEYSIYAAVAGAAGLTAITLTILLVEKIKILGSRIKSFVSEPQIQESIIEVKETDQIIDTVAAPVIAQVSTKKVDSYAELLRQFSVQKTTSKFEADKVEQEKQLPKKPVIPPTKVICPACRKEFSLPIYEKDFIVDFGSPKQSNLIKPCPYCQTPIPLKRKGDQGEIWKE